MAHYMTMCICCFIIFLLSGITLQNKDNDADKCTTARLLGHLPERSIGYKLGDTELPISDYRLTPGWYKLPDNATLATNETECGTYFNWWLKDKLPNKGEANLTMCLNFRSKCAEEKTINVQKCQNGYAYKLNPTDSDMEAYCIDTHSKVEATPDDAPDITKLQPTITAQVVKKNEDNQLEFYCNFTLPDKSYENLLYDIEWSLHSGVSLYYSIHFVHLYKYETLQRFLDKTKLTEQELKKNDITKPGFSLICSVRARRSKLGRVSRANKSPLKFCGVKMLTPSVIRVEQDKTASIDLELTIPFGCFDRRQNCSLDFVMLVPRENKEKKDTCETSKLAHKSSEGRNCGIRFHYKGNKKATFEVTGIFGKIQSEPTSRVYTLALTTASKNFHHGFFANYKLPWIRVELLVNQSPLNGKSCQSYNDPHMITFSGRRYQNMKSGTFIMYKHTDLHIEVQTKTNLCFGSSQVSCNSGIAIRAGRDIFLINSDGEKIIQPPSFVSCYDGVLDRQIIQTMEGVYEISLPHGTKVIVKIKKNKDNIWLNIEIFPSLVDIQKTEGLCGLFQGKEEELGSDFIERWRVPKSKDLFVAENRKKVNQSWSKELQFCTCSYTVDDDDYHKLFNNTVCSQQRKCQVDDFDYTSTKDAKCDIVTKRTKRDTSGILFDAYTDPTTAFHSKLEKKDTSVKQSPRNKRKEPYTNVTARYDCLQQMNTSVFHKCEKIAVLGIDGMVDNCVFDAVMTNSMRLTMAHLDSIKQTCIEYVEVMQPLSEEARAELVVLPDANSTDYVINATYEYATLPPPTLPPSDVDPISPELLQDIKSNSCPNECQGHGQCENGTCKCDEPFASSDCSVNITQPPLMLGIPDKGECDLQQRRCAKTSVFGSIFAYTTSLSCRLRHFVVDHNNKIQYGQSVDVAGYFESMFEVYCRFPESRRKRSVPDEGASDGELAYGYQTSVSNDGKSFSEEDTIIIYDSQCVNCTKVQDTIVCINKSGNCWSQGRCYRPGETSETSECLLCSDEGGANVQWSIAPDCIVDSKHEEPETMGAWKIGLIAAACVVILTVLFLVLLYFVKRKSALRRNGNNSTKFTEIPLDDINQRQM